MGQSNVISGYEEEYDELRRWLARQLDEADRVNTAARHTDDPEAARVRKTAIIEYNRKLDALKQKYVGIKIR